MLIRPQAVNKPLSRGGSTSGERRIRLNKYMIDEGRAFGTDLLGEGRTGSSELSRKEHGFPLGREGNGKT